jgi:hypothetical protein
VRALLRGHSGRLGSRAAGPRGGRPGAEGEAEGGWARAGGGVREEGGRKGRQEVGGSGSSRGRRGGEREEKGRRQGRAGVVPCAVSRVTLGWCLPAASARGCLHPDPTRTVSARRCSLVGIKSNRARLSKQQNLLQYCIILQPNRIVVSVSGPVRRR